ILPGSLYHHFPSKEELFVAVYSFAVAQTLDVVTRAIASQDDPWARLEAACVAHLQSLLEKSRFAAVLVSHPSIEDMP
ncbi:TetR/AcrR family transcriptional regulator, partial [Acinetobacter baumannii]